VWTAAHAEVQGAPVAPKTIVCAVDGPSDETLALVRWAAEYSKHWKATLKLLHAVPPVSDWLAIPTEIELHKQLREQAYEQLDPYLKQTVGVDAPLRVVLGKVTDAIPIEAKQEGADLVLIGRGAAHAAFGRLRSHVFGIVQQSPCPVLSV